MKPRVPIRSGARVVLVLPLERVDAERLRLGNPYRALVLTRAGVDVVSPERVPVGSVGYVLSLDDVPWASAHAVRVSRYDVVVSFFGDGRAFYVVSARSLRRLSGPPVSVAERSPFDRVRSEAEAKARAARARKARATRARNAARAERDQLRFGLAMARGIARAFAAAFPR